MKEKKHRPEQILRSTRKAQVRLVEGVTVPDFCRGLELSEATYHRRRRSGALDEENVGDQALDISILKGGWLRGASELGPEARHVRRVAGRFVIYKNEVRLHCAVG